MTDDYKAIEIKKILNDKEFDFPKNFVMASAWILANYKGVNLKVLDLQKMSSLADYFVIVSATNTTQADSMAQEILHQFKNPQFLKTVLIVSTSDCPRGCRGDLKGPP